MANATFNYSELPYQDPNFYYYSPNTYQQIFQPGYHNASPTSQAQSRIESFPPISTPLPSSRSKRKSPDDDQGSHSKRSRAAQACEQCRYRKQKCDEGIPCAFCKDNNLKCSYRPPAPSKYYPPKVILPTVEVLTHMRTDKFLDFMMTWISSQTDAMCALAEKIDGMEKRLSRAQPDEVERSREESSRPGSGADQACIPKPGNLPNTLDRMIKVSQTVMSWPSICAFLDEAGVRPATDYIKLAEERPILQLREECNLDANCNDDDLVPSSLWIPGSNAVFPPLIWEGPSHTSGLGLNLSAENIDALLESFLDKVHILHPFVDVAWLRWSVMSFKNKYCTACWCTSSSVLPYGEIVYNQKGRQSGYPRNKNIHQRFERSPATVIILLVLAIGEVAAHPGSLPSTSGPLAPFTYGSNLESLEPFPGVPYFSEAAHIIGDFMDGNTCEHAQVFLLAGMYKAQLARSIEAASWYNAAGRVLSHLIQGKQLYHVSKTHHRANQENTPFTQPMPSEYGLILRAAWACIQLETEVSTSLRLPSSNLRQFEDILLSPFSITHQTVEMCPSQLKDDERRQLAYAAQVQLRKHRRMRRPDAHSTPEQLHAIIKEQATALQTWRNCLPSALRWDDRESPSSDMAMARLRSAYWDAKLEMLKPFLLSALHPSDQKNALGPTAVQNNFMATAHRLSQSSGEGEGIRLAQLCISALKQSVAAYDGIRGRPTVPNIQSVAHSRFENTLLLLVATERCDSLKSCTSAEELKALLAQTIEFLKGLAALSPTCAADCNILQGCWQCWYNG